MSKKFFILGAIAILVLTLAFTQAFAKGGTAKTTTTKHTQAANVFAVCGCGNVFTPTSTTEYITVNGKSYACCSHACHEQATAMAAKDPAGMTKSMDEKIAMAKEKLSTTTTQAVPK